MTLPKKLEEKRDAMCEAYKQDCLDNWHSPGLYLKPDFKKGFEEACKLLLPEIKKLEEAVKQGAHYLTFHSQGRGATEFYQMNEDADKISKALQSLREFLGSEAENE